jgi:glyoxylase-like metal-dependent hydrolase (beta-lactamase superfamily II)
LALKYLRFVLARLGLGLAAWGLFGFAVAAVELPPMVPQQVSPSAWFVQGAAGLGSPGNQNFISNAGFVVTKTSVVVIDALGSPAAAERLVAVIKKITPLPISHVLVSHYHADHIYGLQVFKDLGAKIMAGRESINYLNSETARLRLKVSRIEMAPWIDDNTRLVPPDQLLNGPSEMEIGGLLLQLRPVGPAHTPEDYTVYLPQEKVLFAGDLVFRSRIPFVGDADSRHWVTALDELLTFGAKVVVPGHGPVSEEPVKDMKMTRDYLLYLRDAMGRATELMDPFEMAYKNTDWTPFEHLPLFKAANRMNAYNTYLLLEHEAIK